VVFELASSTNHEMVFSFGGTPGGYDGWGTAEVTADGMSIQASDSVAEPGCFGAEAFSNPETELGVGATMIVVTRDGLGRTGPERQVRTLHHINDTGSPGPVFLCLPLSFVAAGAAVAAAVLVLFFSLLTGGSLRVSAPE
jgi:hypothetical protein